MPIYLLQEGSALSVCLLAACCAGRLYLAFVPPGNKGQIKSLTFVAAMKFYDKYPQLKDKGFLAQVLANTVFSTMTLENQQVSMQKVREIVSSLLEEQELKGGQFFSNQSR